LLLDLTTLARNDDLTARQEDEAVAASATEDELTTEAVDTPRTRSSLPRNVWVVTATSFLTDISSEMLVWLLPLYLVNVLGAKTAAIGLIEGTAETTASMLKLFSGWLSDVIGRRKWLAVAGYGLSTVAKPFLLVASSWPGILAVRVGDRVGKGIRTAPRDALLADSVDPASRGLAFGVHRAGDTAGAVIGVVIALIATSIGLGSSRVLTPVIFRWIVLASLIPAAFAVLILALLTRETASTPGRRQLPRLSLAPFDQRFRVFLVVMFLFTLGNSSDAFLVLRAQASGLSVSGILGMVLSYNLVYSVLSGPAGALSDRIGRRTLLISGWLVYALIYLGFARISAGWQAWTLMTLYGLYAALTEGVAKAFVADLVPPPLRGTAYGIFHTAIGLGALPASVLAGVLWEGLGSWPGWGPAAPFYFGASLALTATILLALFLPADVADRFDSRPEIEGE
jgi:MFS family permease